MTQFCTFTDAERVALTLHGLDTHRPSQLSDAFVLGMRYIAGAMPAEPLLSDEEIDALLITVAGFQPGSAGGRIAKDRALVILNRIKP